jgi:hypothetical protein
VVSGTPIDLAKMRSVGVISKRTKAVVTDARRPDGVRVKITADEAGRVVEHNTKDNRVDAYVTPQSVTVTRAQLKEQHDGT